MNQGTAHQILRTSLAEIESAARRLEGAALLVEGIAPELGEPGPPYWTTTEDPPTDLHREWQRTRAAARGAVDALQALGETDLVHALEAIDRLARTPE